MTAAHPADRRPLAGSLLRGTVSLLCIAATAWWVSHQPAPRLPTSAGAWALIALAAATTLVTSLARGLRWSAILHAADAGDVGREPYPLTAVGYMGNTVLPARGGDILRVTLLAKERGVDWKLTTGTLIPERLLDLAVVGSLLALLTVIADTGSLGPWPGIVAAIALALGAAGALVYRQLRGRHYFEGFAMRLRPFVRPSRVLIDRRSGPRLVALSFAIWLIEVLVLWLVVAGSSSAISVTSAALVVVLVSVASAIPAAPGFIGTFDAAAVFGLHAAGVPAEVALSTAVIYRLVVFVPITLVGLVLMIARYGGLRSVAKASAEGNALLEQAEHGPIDATDSGR